LYILPLGLLLSLFLGLTGNEIIEFRGFVVGEQFGICDTINSKAFMTLHGVITWSGFCDEHGDISSR